MAELEPKPSQQAILPDVPEKVEEVSIVNVETTVAPAPAPAPAPASASVLVPIPARSPGSAAPAAPAAPTKSHQYSVRELEDWEADLNARETNLSRHELLHNKQLQDLEAVCCQLRKEVAFLQVYFVLNCQFTVFVNFIFDFLQKALRSQATAIEAASSNMRLMAKHGLVPLDLRYFFFFLKRIIKGSFFFFFLPPSESYWHTNATTAARVAVAPTPK